MSFNSGSFVPERFEFHAAKLFIGQNIHGKNKKYSDLKETYQITILSNDLFLHDDNALVHTLLYYDPVNKVSLKGKTKIVIMELVKAGQVIEKPVCEMSGYEVWAAYFRYLTDIDKRAKINEIVRAKEGIAMASESLGTFSRDEIEYFRRLSEEMYELDVQNRETILRDEGRAEGRAEGIAEGRNEGLAEGIQQGHAEGRVQGRFDTARNALAEGLPIDVIRKITGLSPEEIAKL
jgi:predicted transposase/invertase (TIGR01784 family)